MPARKMSQSKESRELFYWRIKEKVQKDKDRLKGQIEEELPSWAAWVLKPLAGLYHDVEMKNNSRGVDGEVSAFYNLFLFLSKGWVVLNDVVLEPEPDEFAQIDHVLVGPPGVFLIETKAWEGAFAGLRDYWKRKKGSGWVDCSNPTKQNKRHVELFMKWLADSSAGNLLIGINQLVFPAVVFTRAKWLKAIECSMPVFDSAMSLAWYISSKANEHRLTQEQIDAIAGLVANTQPLSSKDIGCLRSKTPPNEKRSGPMSNGCRVENPVLKGNAKVDAKSYPSTGTIAVESHPAKEDNKLREEHINTGKSNSEKDNCAVGKIPKVEGPAKSYFGYERRKTMDGREYVRVYGSREEAQAIREGFEKNGENPGQLKPNIYDNWAWYFNLG
jgi:hypothetical protein